MFLPFYLNIQINNNNNNNIIFFSFSFFSSPYSCTNVFIQMRYWTFCDKAILLLWNLYFHFSFFSSPLSYTNMFYNERFNFLPLCSIKISSCIIYVQTTPNLDKASTGHVNGGLWLRNWYFSTFQHLCIQLALALNLICDSAVTIWEKVIYLKRPFL